MGGLGGWGGDGWLKVNGYISERMTGVFGHFCAHIHYDLTGPGSLPVYMLY